MKRSRPAPFLMRQSLLLIHAVLLFQLVSACKSRQRFSTVSNLIRCSVKLWLRSSGSTLITSVKAAFSCRHTQAASATEIGNHAVVISQRIRSAHSFFTPICASAHNNITFYISNEASFLCPEQSSHSAQRSAYLRIPHRPACHIAKIPEGL